MSAALRRSFSSLQLRNYRLYFTGQVVSLAGNWMQIVAELWLILTLTDSGIYVGLATALQFTGILLFGALGGALADRFDKRKLLMVSQTGMAIPALLLFALVASGAAQAWMVLVVIGLRGLVLSVDNPARQAFVIEIVGPDRVVNAVGLNSVLVHSARITGPAIAGVIIALWGVSPVFALNALSFVAMLVALWMMDPSKLSRPEPKRTRGGVREAIRYVAGSRDLSVPLALMAVLGTLGFNFQVIIPILAERSFDGNVAAYSLLMIAMGIGSIAGAVIFGARNRASKALIAGAAAGFGLAALLAAAAPTLALEMLALAVLGLCSVTFAAGINSGLQLAAAPDMRGRVMALYSIVFLGSTPLGGPLAGWLGESVGPRAPLVLAGVAALAVAAAAALLWSERRPAVTETVAAFRERISERRPRPVRIVRRRGEHSAPETGSHPVVRRS
ncbi:MAG: MFS transporter [Solirubrobacterales bacterium]|nr:MFS transporter [Solirubrobacterales bacterium]MCB8970790.1 MFS transporter [Thermoleophilales bacterium]MCO5327658.1 MFS transporter [Solirubrobacterales bacterium]